MTQSKTNKNEKYATDGKEFFRYFFGTALIIAILFGGSAYLDAIVINDGLFGSSPFPPIYSEILDLSQKLFTALFIIWVLWVFRLYIYLMFFEPFYLTIKKKYLKSKK